MKPTLDRYRPVFAAMAAVGLACLAVLFLFVHSLSNDRPALLALLIGGIDLTGFGLAALCLARFRRVPKTNSISQ